MIVERRNIDDVCFVSFKPEIGCRSMDDEGSFSQRQGYVRPREIVYRDELPPKLRQPLVDILQRSCGSRSLWERIERRFNPYGIDDWPTAGEPIPISKEEDPPEFINTKRVLLQCEWFRIYDLIEDLFRDLDFHDVEFRNPDEDFQAYPFQRNINDYFEYAGIGWKLADGKIVARGDDAFERTVQTAEVELKDGGRTTAADCIEDAIRNLSFRPKPRLGAAVARATNAMECVLHDITAEEKMTLGDYLKRYPLLFPGGLAGTFGGLWGYASSAGARHGKEGVEPPREEAEFIVATAAALTTYLNRKRPRA